MKKNSERTRVYINLYATFRDVYWRIRDQSQRVRFALDVLTTDISNTFYIKEYKLKVFPICIYISTPFILNY